MPAATPKRVKNARISRPFLVGSESWELDASNRRPDTPADHTKGWRVFVRVADGQPSISTWLRKVQFKIFHTYSNPVRVVETPPFEITETGWGGFLVDIKLFFAPEAAAKPEMRTHFLQLEPYGDEAKQASQRAARRVDSVFMDVVDFNEPPESFFVAMTSDEQWVGKGGAGRGKGKAKGKARAAIPGTGGQEGGTVELPERGTEHPFVPSRDMERMNVEQLNKAFVQVEEMLKEEMKKHQGAHQKLVDAKTKLEGASNATPAANGEANGSGVGVSS